MRVVVGVSSRITQYRLMGYEPIMLTHEHRYIDHLWSLVPNAALNSVFRSRRMSLTKFSKLVIDSMKNHPNYEHDIQQIRTWLDEDGGDDREGYGYVLIIDPKMPSNDIMLSHLATRGIELKPIE